MNGSTSHGRSNGNGQGLFGNLALRIKLILRLMGDARVNPLLKLLPIGALLYAVIPEPVIGPFDDAILLWLGTTLFVELCPEHIVREHWDALTKVVEGEWRELTDDERAEIDPPD